jgi:hypothetical protein
MPHGGCWFARGSSLIQIFFTIKTAGPVSRQFSVRLLLQNDQAIEKAQRKRQTVGIASINFSEV